MWCVILPFRRMCMEANVGKRLSRLWAVLVLIFTACGGGGPTGPSPVSNSLEGTWRGTVVFSKPTPMTVPTTWTFRPIGQTAGQGFDTTASWMGITTQALTSTSIGSQFSTAGAFPVAPGCDGFLSGLGTVDGRTIDSSFGGSSSCASTFEGHLTLTR